AARDARRGRGQVGRRERRTEQGTMSTLRAEDLMTLAIQKGASDLHLNPGRPPVLRIDGSLVPQGETPLDDAASEALSRSITSEDQWREVRERGTTDFGLAHSSGNRFRVSVMRQRGRFSAVLRLIPSKLLSLAEIGLPEQCLEILKRPRGLV